tara:strand:- start:2159 stop:2857 length:699 start_codon:yes stop_codon:yes gene_type:complete
MARTAKITNANVPPRKNTAGLVGNTPVRAQDFNDLVGDYISSSDASAQSVASALTVTGAASLSSTLAVTGISTFTAGSINSNVITQSGTAAEDLTSVAADTVWIASTTQAGDITLPQATAANAGMKIKIVAGADWSGTQFKLGFANGGSTVMFGTLTVLTHDANSAAVGFKVTDNAKALVIDSADINLAGGAKGSVYNFTYISANLVLVEAVSYITTGTVATNASASVTAGI